VPEGFRVECVGPTDFFLHEKGKRAEEEQVMDQERYDTFLASKRPIAVDSGRTVADGEIHPLLYDFQRDLTRWACRKGRAAIFADCGLGKTLMQLEWARLMGGTALILAPLSVGEQTIREAAKLGIEVVRVRDGDALRPGIQIGNYEIIHRFIGAPIDALVLDESSILKSIDGKTRGILLSEFKSVPAKLCCTATPCPNDIAELANHAEFLGLMTRAEMLASFFVHDDEGWRMRGHAGPAFYRWLSSWAMALRSPADLNYDGSRFILPALEVRDIVVRTEWRRDGELFPGRLEGITERSRVRKSSVTDRVEAAAQLVNNTEGQVIVWCGLNDEADAATEAIAGAVNVAGSDGNEAKVEKIMAFTSGATRVLITKPKIGGFGMNFQNAATMIFLGLGDSFESYYQCIRRCWRFGQIRPVTAWIVVTDHEIDIVANVRRKETDNGRMVADMIAAAREGEMEELGRAIHAENIERDRYEGDGWLLLQGDCVEEMGNIEDATVDLSVFSPPFISLYTYSATERDIGNSSSEATFFEHFGFVARELLRVTRQGRICCVHVSQVPALLVKDGRIGLKDFRGHTIDCFEANGWTYHGEVCIDKDPQAQAIRTHSKGLLFVQMRKDASWIRPALADYILVFRKPGECDNPIKPDLTNDEWIEWARPIWYGIRESDTLNVRDARSDDDDRHICPLQIGTIERCVRLWSNPGDTVLSPFAGIGSEGVVAVQHGRRFIGCELKPLYAKVAARNLADAVRSNRAQGSLNFATRG
jgi:DNA modification methylase